MCQHVILTWHKQVAKDGSVFSYGSSFYDGAIPATPPVTKRAHVWPVQALVGVTNILDLPVSAAQATAKPLATPNSYTITGTTGAYQDPKARLVYFANGDSLTLAWRVETDIYDDWFLSYVDAVTNEQILGIVSYSADATYEVYPWPQNDPTEGDRIIAADPWELTASRFTWQGDGTTIYDTTEGNNGVAQANFDGSAGYLNKFRPVSETEDFQYPLNLNTSNFTSYASASVTQLFYTANNYHDLLWDLGFTESAGNFEINDGDRGGVGGDNVILNAQDGSGKNNANFATPPDGQMPRMRMYIWNYTEPVRDCAFEAGVIIHEYTHGLSNRLTGGPANTACLNVLEAGGMGEGWGDFMATAIRTKTTDTRDTDYGIGTWVFNNPKGLRAYAYSTSLTRNPYTYATANSLNEVHAIGTIWATMLYEMMWNLIDAYGNTAAIRPTFDSAGVPTDGRYLAMKLIVDSLALQPCNPDFIQSRDAILDADTNLTGGANACSIWTAFAKRGLGANAARNTGTSRTEDYTIPDGVC